MELALRLPMEYIPDPRTVIEDAQDKEKEERDAAERRKVRNKIFKIMIERGRRAYGKRSPKTCETRREKEEVRSQINSKGKWRGC